jgi:UPF0755 protein
MWRWIKRGIILAVVCLLVGGAGLGWLYWQAVEPYRGYTTPEVFVDIPRGANRDVIGQKLIDAGVIRDEMTFRVAVIVSGRASSLKAGEYRFTEPMHALDVIDKIVRGDVYQRLLTFREGLTIREMSQVFEEKGFGTAADFQKAATNVSLIADLDPAATDLEGYLFPETYSLPRDTAASALVEQMVAGFKKALTADIRDAAKQDGLDVRELVTLASLVEKETGAPDERPLVAAVYRNRLKVNMGMQADPTVIYALQKAGKYNGNLSRDNLQFDSPYNTYKYAGLPPGPIAAPGKASLQAAARPAAVDYLYFVSRNDGTHVFATTLDEHNKNVFEWQVQYFRKQRELDRERGTRNREPAKR